MAVVCAPAFLYVRESAGLFSLLTVDIFLFLRYHAGLRPCGVLMMLRRIGKLLGLERKSASGYDDLAAMLGARPTAAGVSVGPESALRCSPAWACIRIIAETVEQVPLHLYRRTEDGGRERANDHTASRVLKSPNPWTTPAELKQLVGMHLAVHGNFFAYVNAGGSGPEEIIPLDPKRVTVAVDEVTMAPIYRVTMASGQQREYSRAEILHVRGPGPDLYSGASPVKLASEAIGLSLTIENHSSSMFSHGAKPSGLLKVKSNTSEGALRTVRAMFEQFYNGSGGKKTMILDDSMSFEQVQLTSVDAQTLEMRRFQVAEISRYWRVPLSLLNDLERVTHANAEALGQQFLTFCMLPIFRSITDAMALTLLTVEERETFYFEFMVDDLARADLAARMTAYSQAVAHGIYNPNELRAMDNRSGYGGGEIYTRPLNVGAVSTTPASTTTSTGSAA